MYLIGMTVITAEERIAWQNITAAEKGGRTESAESNHLCKAATKGDNSGNDSENLANNEK